MAEAASNQEAGQVPVFKRGSLIGLALFALSQVCEAVGYALSGDWGGALVFGGATLVGIFVLGGLVVRFRAWAMIPTVVLVVVGWFVFQGYNLAYEITHPESFFDFVPSVLALAGVLIVLISGTVALRQTRSRTVRFNSLPAERVLAGALVLGFAVLAIISGVLTMTGRSTVSAEDKVGALSVKMRQTEFSPDRIEAPAGQRARVVVKNDDPFLHTFTMDDFEVDVTVRPGSEKLVELPAVTAGSYAYECEIDGHESMKGTLEVQ